MVAPTSYQSLPSLIVLRYLSLHFLDFDYGTVTLFGQVFQTVCLSRKVKYTKDPVTLRLAPEFRLFPFRSSLTQGISFDFFSSGYLDISVHRVAFPRKCGGSARLRAQGFLHSDTAGSLLHDSFPTTFVVLHVLLRHTMPRHPLPASI